MQAKFIFLVILITGFLFSSIADNQKNTQDKQQIEKTDNQIIGKWVRIGPNGPVGFNFKDNRLVEGDFGNDQTIDVIDNYEIKNDTIKFIDKEGQMCEGYGQYKIYQTNYYLSFDLIEDNCGGRIKTTMGFWTRPDFEDLIAKLEKEISNLPKPETYLNRARIYMAIGKPKLAKEDFDIYILSDTINARAYVNRAGTRFPDDMEGVVFDCNKAISIEPDNKNAYFLRGLARYELGEKEQACEDFNKAIELGFSVLKIAEQDKCAEFWNKK